MSLPKPTAILFDWDNTLVDTWPMIHTALNMTLRHMEHPEWDFAKVKANVKQSMRDAFPAMFNDRWQEAAQHYQDSYRSIHLETLHGLEDVEMMLARAGEIARLGIVSNKKGPTLRKELAHIGWEKYFGTAFGSDDAPRDKPAPDPALMALEALEIKPTRSVWFVGDTVVDLECGAAIGATVVLYGDHAVEGDNFEGAKFDAHVRSHAELTTLISNAR